jgi:hypothetical protein
VIVCDFDFVGIVLLPTKADPVLFIDPDAVLPLTVSAESLQPIPRWNAQLLEILHPIQLIELPTNYRSRGSGAADGRPLRYWERADLRAATIETDPTFRVVRRETVPSAPGRLR